MHLYYPNLYTVPIDDRPEQRSAAAVATTKTTTMCATEEENKQHGRTLGAAASKGGPSVEALAMAGARRCMPAAACCSEPDHVEDDDAATPPEHLRAFEAFLEEVVPVGMIMASRREEEARLRRGGKPRSYDDDMKEKLKLWARAVARETTGGRR